MASQNGHAVCVQQLLQAGADVEACSGTGSTPLHHAVERNHVDCMLLLVAAGAPADVANLDGYTALHMAVEGDLRLVSTNTHDAAHEVDVSRLHISAMLVASLPSLAPQHQLLRASALDQERLADESHLQHAAAVQKEVARRVALVMLHGESRWRRRRALALIREQRLAAKDDELAQG